MGHSVVEEVEERGTKMLVRKNIIGFAPLITDIEESRKNYIQRFFYITEKLISEAQNNPAYLNQAHYDLSEYSRFITLNVDAFVLEEDFREEEIKSEFFKRHIMVLEKIDNERHTTPAENDYVTSCEQEWHSFKLQFDDKLPTVSYKIIDINNTRYAFITVEFK